MYGKSDGRRIGVLFSSISTFSMNAAPILEVIAKSSVAVSAPLSMFFTLHSKYTKHELRSRYSLGVFNEK